MSDIIRLHLGCGGVSIAGFVPVDAKLGHDVRKLDYADGVVDEIYASHVLEHLPQADVLPALREWCRVLRVGGRLRVAVPDFAYVAREYLAGNVQLPLAEYIMGGQRDEHDFHRSVFDRESLKHLLEKAGFEHVEPFAPVVDDCTRLPVSLNLQAIKAKPKLYRSSPLPRITAVMSMPRLAFADNMFCGLGVATSLHIPFVKTTGAFWAQCMERVMTPLLNDGTEYILTVDYDTVFDAGDVLRLVDIMERHADIDVLAPLQVKRDEDTLLLRPRLADGTDGDRLSLGELNGSEVTRVSWAHFGLTLLRTSSLKRLPHPWFWDQPDKSGQWGDGRVDADIYFWRKANEHGLKTCLANNVSVGHLQLMVTWPTDSLGVTHQYATEWQRRGRPTRARQTR